MKVVARIHSETQAMRWTAEEKSENQLAGLEAF